MGTDIHSIVQVRRDGVFHTVGIAVIGDPRNYDLFAMLANVRNGYGFAGIPTSSGFTPIAIPRGLPADLRVVDDNVELPEGVKYAWDWDGNLVDPASDDARRLKYNRESMWLGEHSQSHLTLAELKVYVEETVKKQSVTKYGQVALGEYRAAKREGRSFSGWCGAVSGPGVQHITEAEATLTYDGPEENVYVQAQWLVACETNWDLSKLVEALSMVQTEEGVAAEDVRYVFGFDS